jgi:hypothetical protein
MRSVNIHHQWMNQKKNHIKVQRVTSFPKTSGALGIDRKGVIYLDHFFQEEI